ncbi:hypothetical protein FOTG_11284 [Fusarium oxysporum f. sp. vasinfectum 25433]|uniref:Uncharacterized protein n=1 Tax=Fusarium oxysporum f. sp. vasinfectum 25433 TaxID=1089449 RepID=X0LIB2_FUSOX|nr:hypothetical protein FOTG_11284 [Fusarium oxysporum f. sp. vasinfectum 25433]
MLSTIDSVVDGNEHQLYLHINDRGLGMIVIYTVYNLEVTIQWSEVKQ